MICPAALPDIEWPCSDLPSLPESKPTRQGANPASRDDGSSGNAPATRVWKGDSAASPRRWCRLSPDSKPGFGRFNFPKVSCSAGFFALSEVEG